MQIDFKVTLNEKLYIRNPESTETGKLIIKHAIIAMYEVGYEQFTFKKLAAQIPTTEATVYRYFENKHKLLIYLIDWYWAYMRFQVMFSINNLTDDKEKIKKIIDLLVWEDNSEDFTAEHNHKALYYISIAEGSKIYLSKEVDNNNKDKFYEPFKELCELIADIFRNYNPTYKYPKSLASTLVETSHFQYYFMNHLPRLSDFAETKNAKIIESFLENIVFGALDAKE
jgi:AcrR family transcriptional regulator